MAIETPPQPGRPYALIEARGEASLSELPVETVYRLYRAHGALLVRGFAADVASFGALAGQLSGVAMPNEGPRRTMIDAARKIQTVAGGRKPFPLHPELSREPWQPDIAMFACLSPPAAGGETLICDGAALAAAMPPPVRAAFEGRRLLYRYLATPEQLAYWLGSSDPDDAALAAAAPHCPFTFSRRPGGVVREFTRPALRRTMFGEAPAFANFLVFARYLKGIRNLPLFEDGSIIPHLLAEAVRVIGERLSAPIAWAANDVLILDNTRFLHGRNAIADEGARRIVSYFGYLRDAPADPEDPPDPPWRRPGFVPP